MEVFVTGIVHSFGNDNSKRRMYCSCIGMGLVMGKFYVLVWILESVSYGNIIHLCYYFDIIYIYALLYTIHQYIVDHIYIYN